MYRIVPSPLGGMWLQNENGVVVASGTNIHSLKSELNVLVERRSLSPFLVLSDEFGRSQQLKEYLKK